MRGMRSADFVQAEARATAGLMITQDGKAESERDYPDCRGYPSVDEVFKCFVVLEVNPLGARSCVQSWKRPCLQRPQYGQLPATLVWASAGALCFAKSGSRLAAATRRLACVGTGQRAAASGHDNAALERRELQQRYLIS